MANGNKINSEDIDWSGSSGWSSTKFLRGDGVWALNSSGSTQTFANLAARNAAVPDFNGQIGVQIDIDAVFQSTGTSAGNWIDIIPIGNTIYANSVTGHTLAQGATGSKSNPFSTLQEAITKAETLSPTSTLRPLVDAMGTFAGAQTILKNLIDINLNNSVINYEDATNFAFTDNNATVDCIIYGNATIFGRINIQNTSSNVRIDGEVVNYSLGTETLITVSGATAVFNIRTNHTGGGFVASISSDSIVTVNRDWTTTGGRVLNTSGTSVTTANNATLTSTATLTIQMGNTSSVKLNSCRVVSSGATAISATSGAVSIVLKDSTIISTTTSILITGGGNVLCYGKSQANKPIDSLTTTSIGDLIINASVI